MPCPAALLCPALLPPPYFSLAPRYLLLLFRCCRLFAAIIRSAPVLQACVRRASAIIISLLLRKTVK